MSTPEYLTRKQLAALLHISERHLINCERSGMPSFRLGGAVRYRLDEVQAYLIENRALSMTVRRRREGPTAELAAAAATVKSPQGSKPTDLASHPDEPVK
ncbi:MAG: DNA-binding protein [Verrucomicrobia bacterium]|nr:DNA-binding protein [Verrucomicrobiota bacterium]NBU09177.1 DNA-binding protein [Pseudomonadota bacterium]NDA67054.1 DNA-binding protein [Verrucomicrobiota bacterium]NDB75732.1 DNA-binding protein [Verrucomicrobiota bacterium]NDD39053.1 DNA-binding protein [Verrucomicrobiota bacterium]